VGLAPGGGDLAGAISLSNGPSNLQGGSDGKTALESGKQGGQTRSRLPAARALTDALVTHPWYVRITGALTIAGILNGLADRVFDFSTAPLIVTLVGVFLLSLSGIAFAQRHVPAQRVASPVEQLQLQLDKAMTLRGIVIRGVPQHWEGDVLVPDDPEAERRIDDLVFAWVKDTYNLLRKPPFTRHADEFWGRAFRSLESGYLRAAYGTERDKLGLDTYLHDRVELLKRILKEHGG
jgi:hypothetical protein